MNSAWESSCIVQSWFVLSGMQAESSILWEEQTLLFSRLADGHKWPFLHHEGSSFVLPPTPGNETKSPERNFHPRLIMKRISLITLVDCGHCSASFSKKKEEKSCWKYFNALLLLWARPSVNPFGISSFLSPSIALPNSAYFISLPLISVLASAYSSVCSLL